MTEINAERKAEIEVRLKGIFREHYTDSDFAEGFTAEGVKSFIESRIGVEDIAIEGLTEEEKAQQADVNTKFFFGHNHDFGSFQIKGKMGDRHTHLPAAMMAFWGLPIDYFRHKLVLDVGCWGGGTSLMLAALGANVVACEPVVKHAEMAKYLTRVFGVEDKIEIHAKSLYGCDMRDHFDVVFFPGVFYHISDMIIGLRILYNALKVGGELLLESASRQMKIVIGGEEKEGNFIEYWGPSRGGNNWFVPNKETTVQMLRDVGFEVIDAEYLGDSRQYAYARKMKWSGIRKAGLSRIDV